MDDRGRWHNVPRPAPHAEPDDTGNNAPRYVCHMEVGERVEIVKADGTRIKAMFWEAKGNKVVLRTLPIHEG